MHALIIEPKNLVAMAIVDALRQVGFTQFSYAATRDEALAEAELRCPDLITSNVRVMDGERIKAVEAICPDKPIPVVFVAESEVDGVAEQTSAILLCEPFPAKALVEAVTMARVD